MDDADRRRCVDNLQAELDGASLYHALAQIEDGSELATVYTRMAETVISSISAQSAMDVSAIQRNNRDS